MTARCTIVGEFAFSLDQISMYLKGERRTSTTLGDITPKKNNNCILPQNIKQNINVLAKRR